MTHLHARGVSRSWSHTQAEENRPQTKTLNKLCFMLEGGAFYEESECRQRQ